MAHELWHYLLGCEQALSLGRLSVTSCDRGVVEAQEKLSQPATSSASRQGSWVEENVGYTAIWRSAERSETPTNMQRPPLERKRPSRQLNEVETYLRRSHVRKEGFQTTGCAHICGLPVHYLSPSAPSQPVASSMQYKKLHRGSSLWLTTL